jgi:hypothetical protein
MSQIQRGYYGSHGPCALPREELHHLPRSPNGQLVGTDNRKVERGLNRSNVDHPGSGKVAQLSWPKLAIPNPAQRNPRQRQDPMYGDKALR